MGLHRAGVTDRLFLATGGVQRIKTRGVHDVVAYRRIGEMQSFLPTILAAATFLEDLHHRRAMLPLSVETAFDLDSEIGVKGAATGAVQDLPDSL